MKKLWDWMDVNHPVDGAYGPLVEDINYYLFLIGWNSLEVSYLLALLFRA
jgi:hypothetical protein